MLNSKLVALSPIFGMVDRLLSSRRGWTFWNYQPVNLFLAWIDLSSWATYIGTYVDRKPAVVYSEMAIIAMERLIWFNWFSARCFNGSVINLPFGHSTLYPWPLAPPSEVMCHAARVGPGKRFEMLWHQKWPKTHHFSKISKCHALNADQRFGRHWNIRKHSWHLMAP